MKIAVLGGTGRQGSGLVRRWVRAGHQIIIGSRSPDRAREATKQLNLEFAKGIPVVGMDNGAAAAAGQLVVLAVPYRAQRTILQTVREEIQGKPLLSVVVPFDESDFERAWQPPGGSAAEEAQRLVGAATPVLIAFQNVSAADLADLTRPLDHDILVCGDNQLDKRKVMDLVVDAGMRPVDAGPLANASVVEGLTAILIGIKKKYRGIGTGIRIMGTEGDDKILDRAG